MVKGLSHTLVGATIAASLALSACGSGQDQDEAAPEGMGNAQAQPSPQDTHAEGTVYPYADVSDLDTSDGIIAVRTDDAITIGTLDEITGGSPQSYDLDPACGDVSGRNGRFVVACGDTVRTFSGSGEDTPLIVDPRATVAALTSSGEIITGSESDRSVQVYRDGKQVSDFSVARESDQLFSVARDGSEDAVVRVNHFDTTIQDMDWQNKRQGGTLRAGLGVGGTSSGGDGLVLAADNTGNQLLVYTVTDVIRLEQTAPVDPSPWAVAWDGHDNLAWVTSTADNTVSGYDISQGVPLQRKKLQTIADAHNMIALDDGTLVIASATGQGLQVLSPTDKGQ